MPVKSARPSCGVCIDVCTCEDEYDLLDSMLKEARERNALSKQQHQTIPSQTEPSTVTSVLTSAMNLLSSTFSTPPQETRNLSSSDALEQGQGAGSSPRQHPPQDGTDTIISAADLLSSEKHYDGHIDQDSTRSKSNDLRGSNYANSPDSTSFMPGNSSSKRDTYAVDMDQKGLLDPKKKTLYNPSDYPDDNTHHHKPRKSRQPTLELWNSVSATINGTPMRVVLLVLGVLVFAVFRPTMHVRPTGVDLADEGALEGDASGSLMRGGGVTARDGEIRNGNNRGDYLSSGRVGGKKTGNSGERRALEPIVRADDVPMVKQATEQVFHLVGLLTGSDPGSSSTKTNDKTQNQQNVQKNQQKPQTSAQTQSLPQDRTSRLSSTLPPLRNRIPPATAFGPINDAAIPTLSVPPRTASARPPAQTPAFATTPTTATTTATTTSSSSSSSTSASSALPTSPFASEVPVVAPGDSLNLPVGAPERLRPSPERTSQDNSASAAAGSARDSITRNRDSIRRNRDGKSQAGGVREEDIQENPRYIGDPTVTSSVIPNPEVEASSFRENPSSSRYIPPSSERTRSSVNSNSGSIDTNLSRLSSRYTPYNGRFNGAPSAPPHPHYRSEIERPPQQFGQTGLPEEVPGMNRNAVAAAISRTIETPKDMSTDRSEAEQRVYDELDRESGGNVFHNLNKRQ